MKHISKTTAALLAPMSLFTLMTTACSQDDSNTNNTGNCAFVSSDCTDEPNNAPNNDDNNAPNNDTPPCEDVETVTLSPIRHRGGSFAAAFSPDALVVGYINPRGNPQLDFTPTGDDAQERSVELDAFSSRFDFSDPQGISLAVNDDTVGMAWGGARTYTIGDFEDDLGAAFFATVSPQRNSSVKMASNDFARTAEGNDRVFARFPSTIATADGFAVFWQDLREQEPDIFADGIGTRNGAYTRRFDTAGNPLSPEDTQVLQDGLPIGVVAGALDNGTITVWSTRDGDNTDQRTVHVLTSDDFGQSEPPAPFFTAPEGLGGIQLAVGHDNNVLLTILDEAQGHGTIMLNDSGTPLGEFTPLDARLEVASLIAKPEGGYILAGFENDETNTLHILQLDADGAVEQRSEHRMEAGRMALGLRDGRLWVTTRAVNFDDLLPQTTVRFQGVCLN